MTLSSPRLNDRKKDPRVDSLPPPRAEQAGKRRTRRPSTGELPPAPPVEDDSELISTLAARLITAEQMRRRAEDREREARARIEAAESRAAESESAPALMSDFARRLSEVGLRITARESLLERDLAEIRALRADVSELTQLAWRLAGPMAASQIPALASTEPPASRNARMSARTSPAIRRQR